MTGCVRLAVIGLLTVAGIQMAPTEIIVTNVTLHGGVMDLGWTASTNRFIVAEASSLTTDTFHYTGPVLTTNGVTLTNLQSTGFYRVRLVAVVNLPDTALETKVRATLPITYDPTNLLYDVETEVITNLTAESAGVMSATGIDQLSNLQQLRLAGNQLTQLSAAMPSLLLLSCDNNQLTDLTLAGCSGLKVVTCNTNWLGCLDLAPCPALQEVYCTFNALTSLNTSACFSLRVLDCQFNLLPALDVSACSQLRTIQCGFNFLRDLNLTACTNLYSLSCSDNISLTQLVVRSSACTNVDCSSDQLPALDLTQCPNLATLDCSGNDIGSMDLSGHTALQSLTCDDNQLTSLSLAGCSGLQMLSCSSNQLTVLDVSACGDLREVYAEGNLITDVTPLGTLTSLRVVNLMGNPITDLSPLITSASQGWLAGCTVYLSGPMIQPAQVATLLSYGVDVIYIPYG